MNTEPLLFFRKLNLFVTKAKYLQGVPNFNESFTVKFEPKKDGIDLN